MKIVSLCWSTKHEYKIWLHFQEHPTVLGVCMYVYIYIYIYICVCVCVCVFVCTHVRMYVFNVAVCKYVYDAKILLALS